jgi:hypothetical protein
MLAQNSLTESVVPISSNALQIDQKAQINIMIENNSCPEVPAFDDPKQDSTNDIPAEMRRKPI